MSEEKITLKVEANIKEVLIEIGKLTLQSDKLKQKQKEVNKSTKEGKKLFNELANEINNVAKSIENYTTTIIGNIKKQEEISVSVENQKTAKKELEEQIKVELQTGERVIENLDATNTKLEENQEAYNKATNTTNIFVAAQKDLEKNLENIINQLTEMASSGKRGSEAYEELIKRAAELQRQLNTTAKDTEKAKAKIETLAKGTFNVTTIFGKLVDTLDHSKTILKAVGIESESLNNVIDKGKEVVNAISAAQKIYNTVLKSQTLQFGIFSKASGLASKAMAWFNGIIAANPIMMLVTAIGLAVAALATLSWGQSKYNKAVKEVNDSIDKNNKALKGELRVAQAKGKSQKELLEIEKQYAEANLEKTKQLEKSTIATWSQRKELKKMTEEAQKLVDTLEDEIRIETNVEDALKLIADANKKAEDEKTAKEAAIEKAKEDAQKKLEFDKEIANELLYIRKANAQDILEIEEGRINEEIAKEEKKLLAAEGNADKQITIQKNAENKRFEAKMEFAKKRFETEQEYTKKEYDLQVKNRLDKLKLDFEQGKIDANEKANNERIISLQTQNFYAGLNKQLKEFNTQQEQTETQFRQSQLDDLMKRINSLKGEVKKTLEDDISSLKKEYAEVKALIDDDDTMSDGDKELEKMALIAEEKIRIGKIEDDIKKRDREKDIKAIQDKYTTEEELHLGNAIKILEIEIKKAEEIAKLKDSSVEDQRKLEELKKKLIDASLSDQLQYEKNSNKKIYEAKKKAIEEKLKLVKKGSDEEKKLLKEGEDLEKKNDDDWLKRMFEYADAVNKAFTALFDFMNQLGKNRVEQAKEDSEEEKAQIDTQVEAGIISKKEGEKKKAEIDKEFKKKEAEEKQKEAIRNKATALFEIGINTAKEISKVLSKPWMIALVAAAGALQAATVIATPLPKAARGRLIGGRSHQQGGEIIEAEAGEMIINKRSASMFAPLLSEINQAGGGVPFTQAYSDGGFSVREYRRQENQGSIDPSHLKDAIMEGMRESNVYVAVEDINKMEDKINQVKVTVGKDYQY